jgi:hypothetical protein
MNRPLDLADITGLVIFLAISVGLPLLGYWLMVIDIRAYLRSFKRALVLVTRLVTTQPSWAVRQPPACLQALGLDETCSVTQVRDAYRRLAETCHPDLGGDRAQFLKLRRHYEQALSYARQAAAERRAPPATT